MKTNAHLRIAGILQIAQSLMILPFSIMYVVLYIQDLREGTHTFALHMALILAIILIAASCQLWLGISLIMKKQWTTRVWGFICCAPGLIAFPQGTLIGAYTIWVMVQVRRGPWNVGKERVQEMQYER